MPTTSNTPTSASRLAAATSAMPWSCAAGIKCVPIRPLVESPHTKKDPDTYQKSRTLAASRNVCSVSCATLPALRTGGCQSGAAPYGSRPSSAGPSRKHSQITGTITSAPAATVKDTLRQPTCIASIESPGRKTSCPLAVAAVSNPITNPRRCTNQRLATLAANTSAIEPVPMPTTTPHSSTRCHGSVINTVAAAPLPIIVSAAITTRRMPKRSIKAAANGAVSPYSKTFTDTAREICARLQPNAVSSGTISTEGAERNPAVATKVRNVIPAAIHAG